MMKTYEITLPIAGHAYLEIEAETAEGALQLAFEQATLDDVQEWTALSRFVQGNVCSCPSPWEAEVVDLGPVEDPA